MASPSRAQVEKQIVDALTLFKNEKTAAATWVTNQDTYMQELNSDFNFEQGGAVSAARAFLAGLLANQTVAAVLSPLLRAYIRHVVNGDNIVDVQVMIDRMYRYMVDNSYTVQSRNFTFGSPAAGGSNVGNGSFLRLNTDQYGYAIENQHPDSKTARCANDQNSGTGVGEELFDVYGQAPGPDGLQVSGSGQRRFIPAMSARNSVLSNTSFDQFSGTSVSPTDITSWTSSVSVSGSVYVFDGSNYYRKFQGTTPYSLKIVGTSVVLTQKLSTFNTKLRSDVPYILQLAWNRFASGTGTLSASLGSVSNSVVVAAQAGWNILRVPSAMGQNCWFKNFNQDDLAITITWANTGGNIWIDDVLLVPGTPFDGGWLWIIGGSTAFLKNDVWTYSDTATDPGLVNYWLWRGCGRYLPSTTGAPTWSNS